MVEVISRHYTTTYERNKLINEYSKKRGWRRICDNTFGRKNFKNEYPRFTKLVIFVRDDE